MTQESVRLAFRLALASCSFALVACKQEAKDPDATAASVTVTISAAPSSDPSTAHATPSTTTSTVTRNGWDQLPGRVFTDSDRELRLTLEQAFKLSPNGTSGEQCPPALDVLALEERIGEALPHRMQRGSNTSYEIALDREASAAALKQGSPDRCVYNVIATRHIGKGRPMIDGNEHVVARLVSSRPRVQSLAPRVPEHSNQRLQLAERWLRDALLEHSSIAELTRIALELLALGAPHDLIEGTLRAAQDEAKHADLCFLLASAYCGQPLTAGSFAMREPRNDGLIAFALRTFDEGCIAETVASVDARAEAAAETDPVVTAVLNTIADDEAEHAELAWACLAWAVQTGGAPVRDALRDHIATAMRSNHGSAPHVWSRVVEPLLPML